MQRPPPEPPDLYSFEVGDGEPPDLNSIAVGECEPESAVVAAKAGSCRTEDLSDAVTEIHSGAEDGAVAKGNVMDDGSADLTRGNSTVVGAFAEGRWTATCRTTSATVADGGLRARQLRRFVLLIPPSLTAAVFPCSRSDEGEEWSRVAVEGQILLPVAKKVESTTEGSTEVGASAQAKQGATKLRGSGCVGVIDSRATWMNGEAPFHRLLPLTARPPPLTAAVVPWDRNSSEKRGAGTGAVGLGGTGTPGYGDRGRYWALPMLAVAPPWMAAGELTTAAWEFLDCTEQRKKSRCSVFNTSSVTTRVSHELLMLTPIEKLDPQVVLQAQYELEQNASEVKYFFQAQLDTIKGGQPIYWVIIARFCFKIWDPGGLFIFGSSIELSINFSNSN